MKRSNKSSFMPNSTVFPGGVKELSDSNAKWTQLYQRLGVPSKNLNDLSIVQDKNRPQIFNQTVGDNIDR